MLLCGCIFCKRYSSSFSDDGCACCISSIIQKMKDHVKEAPGGRRTRDFQSMFVVHTDWMEALHLMSVWFCLSTFPVFYLLYHCIERDIFFSSIFGKKTPTTKKPFITTSIPSLKIVSYRIALNEPIPFLYCITNHVCIIVKTYLYTPRKHQTAWKTHVSQPDIKLWLCGLEVQKKISKPWHHICHGYVILILPCLMKHSACNCCNLWNNKQ